MLNLIGIPIEIEIRINVCLVDVGARAFWKIILLCHTFIAHNTIQQMFACSTAKPLSSFVYSLPLSRTTYVWFHFMVYATHVVAVTTAAV